MIVLYWSVEYFATLVETILCCILVKIFIKNEATLSFYSVHSLYMVEREMRIDFQ